MALAPELDLTTLFEVTCKPPPPPHVVSFLRETDMPNVVGIVLQKVSDQEKGVPAYKGPPPPLAHSGAIPQGG